MLYHTVPPHTFCVHIFDPVPCLLVHSSSSSCSVSRMQTSLRRKHRDRVVRRYAFALKPRHLITCKSHTLTIHPSYCAVASPSSSRAISTRRTPVVSTLPVCKHFTTLHTRTFPCISATHRSLLAVRRSAHFDPVLRSGDVQLYAQRFEPPSQSHHALTFTIARAVDALYAYLSTTNYDFNYDRSKNL